MYSATKKKQYRAPRSPAEIVASFNSSPDGVVFPKREGSIDYGDLRPHDIFPELLNGKIEEYMMSSASQTIRRSGDAIGIQTVFPYSTEPMISVWRRAGMSLKDLLCPKRFVREYVRETVGNKNGKAGLHGSYKAPGYHEWSREFLEKSPAGKSLEEYIFEQRLKGVTSAQRLQRALSEFWLDELFSVLSKEGIALDR